MSSPPRVQRRSRRAVACAALCLGTLAPVACGELAAGPGSAPGAGRGPAAGGAADGAAAPPATASAVASDLVPAPAVFEATGTARWDGRRTLQGVWVAHPEASAARQVRIYNAATGAAADGALFTRDAVLTGPSMLVSSDAARALGLAPGEEAELRVVAVTPRAGAETWALAAPRAIAAQNAGAGAGAGSAAAVAGEARARPGPADPAEDAGRTLASAVGAPRLSAASPSRPPGAAGQAGAANPVTAGNGRRAADAPAVSAERPRTVAGTGDEARPGLPTTPITGADRATAAKTGSTDGLARPSGTAVTPSPAAPRPAAPSLAPPAGAEPARAAPAADAKGGMPAEGIATAGAAGAGAAATPPASAQAGAGALPEPFVQAGVFAVRENAERLVERIEAAGLPALGKPVRLTTGTATRVLAGPFDTVAERDAARRRIQSMGLGDASPVAR